MVRHWATSTIRYVSYTVPVKIWQIYKIENVILVFLYRWHYSCRVIYRKVYWTTVLKCCISLLYVYPRGQIRITYLLTIVINRLPSTDKPFKTDTLITQQYNGLVHQIVLSDLFRHNLKNLSVIESVNVFEIYNDLTPHALWCDLFRVVTWFCLNLLNLKCTAQL